jgi:hypothetical protein
MVTIVTPTAGSTVLGGGSANPGVPPMPIPRPRPRPMTPPGAVPPDPRMRSSIGAPQMGFDPLPQTSGHFDAVSAAGHDSLSPLAAMLLQLAARG